MLIIFLLNSTCSSTNLWKKCFFSWKPYKTFLQCSSMYPWLGIGLRRLFLWSSAVDLSLFCRYFLGFCLREFPFLVSLLTTSGRPTRDLCGMHPFIVQLQICLNSIFYAFPGYPDIHSHINRLNHSPFRLPWCVTFWGVVGLVVHFVTFFYGTSQKKIFIFRKNWNH